MSTYAEILAALDFAPAPVPCGLCALPAEYRLTLSCGCVVLECGRHAAQMMNYAAHYVSVCHAHRVYGVQIVAMKGIEQ